MSDVTFTVRGIPELQRTLRQYAELNTKKTFPEIVNATVLDMAFRALAATVRANAQEIRNLSLRSWWPKYIAKRLAGEGVSVKLTKKQGGGKRLIQGAFTQKDAKLASKQIIAARLRSVSFIASGWLAAIRDLLPLVPGRDRPPKSPRNARQSGQPKGYGKGALSAASIVSRIRAVAGNTAINPKRNPRRAFIIAQRGAELAVQQTTADKQAYIDRKLKEAGQKTGVPLKSFAA